MDRGRQAVELRPSARAEDAAPLGARTPDVALPGARGGGPGPAFLEQLLRPLARWIEAEDVSEIAVNGPGEVWIERAGAPSMERHAVPELDARRIEQLARQVAAFTSQAVNRGSPLLSATLPSGERVQAILPPVSTGGALCIRKYVVRDVPLDAWISSPAVPAPGASEARGAGAPVLDEAETSVGALGDEGLRRILGAGDVVGFLRAAVRGRRNVLVSGGTSSGKTTFLNALAREIPAHERLVTIEDTRELRLPHPNTVSLVASKGDQGDARVSVQDLLEATLRLRPDRILLGELRGAEAYTFLRSINTGHPGSLTTLHADSPARAFEQMALMVLQAGLGLGRSEILEYVRSVVDVVVQVERSASGSRAIAAVEFLRA